MRPGLKRLAIIPPVLLGVVILALVVRGRDAPQRAELGEQSTLVRVVRVPELAVVPRAIGFGTVQPAKDWAAVAEVGGKVVEIHPQLRRGAILPEGVVLLRIDPTDYELALARTEADLASTEAELQELAAREENLRRSRDIEERALALSERDLERKRTLQGRGTISEAALDEQERAVLSNQQRVQELANSLNLLPAERAVLAARQAVLRAQHEQAQLDLERTVIRAPFDLRVAELRVEQTQFVRQGEVLAEADGIAAAEIEAQYPLDRILPLIREDFEPLNLSAEQLAELPARLGLSAQVRLRSGDLFTEWDARVARGSDTIDPRTRAFGIIVTVDEPIRQAIPGRRPPLTKGMFVEVTLSGQPRPGTRIIPRTALQQGDDGATLAYVVGPESRLERRPITIGFGQDDFVTVTGGLEAGEAVIVSDPVPAIDGMLLEMVEDAATTNAILAEAAGDAAATQ